MSVPILSTLRRLTQPCELDTLVIPDKMTLQNDDFLISPFRQHLLLSTVRKSFPFSPFDLLFSIWTPEILFYSVDCNPLLSLFMLLLRLPQILKPMFLNSVPHYLFIRYYFSLPSVSLPIYNNPFVHSWLLIFRKTGRLMPILSKLCVN